MRRCRLDDADRGVSRIRNRPFAVREHVSREQRAIEQAVGDDRDMPALLLLVREGENALPCGMGARAEHLPSFATRGFEGVVEQVGTDVAVELTPQVPEVSLLQQRFQFERGSRRLRDRLRGLASAHQIAAQDVADARSPQPITEPTRLLESQFVQGRVGRLQTTIGIAGGLPVTNEVDRHGGSA